MNQMNINSSFSPSFLLFPFFLSPSLPLPTPFSPSLPLFLSSSESRILFSEETMEALSLKSGRRQECSPYPLFLTLQDVLSMQLDKYNKRYKNWKGRSSSVF